MAPQIAPATDSTHIGHPPSSTMATVSDGARDHADGAHEAPPARVGQPAADDEADAAGRVGEDAEGGDPQRPRTPPRRGGTRS